jgi:hypothetical protein
MGMIDTAIGLGIALELVALYLLSCIRKLRQVAQIMMPYPVAVQMCYLQALADVDSDENSTIIFPLPLELLGPFLRNGR